MALPIRHLVDLARRDQHLVTVSTEIPADVAGPVRLVMPTWTPGSYVMRDYVHHMQSLSVTDGDGQEVAVRPDGHTAWIVDVGGPLTVRAEFYANELTVRTNHVDDHHALLVAPALFLAVEGCRERQHRVGFVGDPVVHGMLPVIDGEHVAATLDLLVDSAFEVEAGRPFPTVSVTAEGVDHTFVWVGHGPSPDLGRIRDGIARIATVTRQLLDDDLPLDTYVFLCESWLAGTGGGLEHREGSVLMMPTAALHTDAGHERFQSLLAHEYLHLANAKRLTPAELVRPSLTQHVHTKSLWVVEGWTAWYDELLVLRAGLSTVDKFLASRAKLVDQVLQRPGATRQSLADASWTAWTKLYVRDENSANAGTDYYGHGAVVAWCLDLLIRRHNPGSGGLDDALRLLWQRFGDTTDRPPTKGYLPADVVAAVSEAATMDLQDFFDRHVTGTQSPPIARLVETVGLAFVAELDPKAPPRLGVVTADDDHGVTITSVMRDMPAGDAGLTGGDRLLAVNGVRVQPGQLDAILAMHEPGDDVAITVFSGPRLRTLVVTLAEPSPTLKLTSVGSPTSKQREAFRDWTGHELPPPGAAKDCPTAHAAKREPRHR